MRIRLRVTPRSSRVELTGPDADGLWHARVSAPPAEGSANKALIELLSDHFHVPTSRIALVSGGSSRLKTFEVGEK